MIDHDPRPTPDTQPDRRESDERVFDPVLPPGTPIHFRLPDDFAHSEQSPARYVCKGSVHVAYTGRTRRASPKFVPVTVLDHDRDDSQVSDGSEVYVNGKWLSRTTSERSSSKQTYTPLPQRPPRMVQGGLEEVIAQAPYDETHGLDPKTGKHK